MFVKIDDIEENPEQIKYQQEKLQEIKDIIREDIDYLIKWKKIASIISEIELKLEYIDYIDGLHEVWEIFGLYPGIRLSKKEQIDKVSNLF